MLDDSSSMKGKPWEDLMKCVTTFMNKICEDNMLRDNTRISVLNHNETSIKYFEE